jgi:futalosine hydrolase
MKHEPWRELSYFCMILNAMNVLLVAATTLEIRPFLDHFRQNAFKNHEVDLLITGPGLMTATHSLTRQVCLKKPDLVIQAGIAGCFNKNIPLGSIVAVKHEVVADEGVVEEKKFKTLFDLKLVKGNQFPYKNGWLVNPGANKLIKENGFKVVNGITVNQITTDPRMVKEYLSRYKAVVESMEGAALHYVCLQSGIPFLQLRGVSNYIGERNKAKWDFQKPIENLNKALITMLEK